MIEPTRFYHLEPLAAILSLRSSTVSSTLPSPYATVPHLALTQVTSLAWRRTTTASSTLSLPLCVSFTKFRIPPITLVRQFYFFVLFLFLGGVDEWQVNATAEPLMTYCFGNRGHEF